MIDELKNIVNMRPQRQALLGMDVGRKTIGLAVSNPDQTIATPVKTIKRTKFSKDLVVIRALSDEFEIGGYVMGYPLNMDGSKGPSCQSVYDFAAEFEKQMGVEDMWIALWDERLSTVHVEELVDESVGISKRSAKSRGITDQLAAQVILQSALDYIARVGAP